MTTWQEVRDLVVARRVKALVGRVAVLTEAERAEVARRLPELLAELRENAERKTREDWRARLLADYGAEDDWPSWLRSSAQTAARSAGRDGLAEFGTPLRIVGAGTISGPAAAVAWLARREFAPRWAAAPPPAELVRTLATRPAAWQADVAVRLARKIRTADDHVIPLALALLRTCGVEPPRHDPLVLAWLSAGTVEDDPLTDTLLPRIFEAEGVGRALREERLTPAPTLWLARIQWLLKAGKVSREEFLDGCLSRFLRGGDAVDLRFFVRLHELLAPEPHEAAARARDYLRLLPTAPSAVATLALAQVRRTGPHDAADVAEAIDALVFRPEAKLADAGLRWLDEEVRRAPELAGETASALATAFAHTSYQVQRRAARIAVKRAAAFGGGAATITDAVPSLPADLGAQVAAVFGGEIAGAETPEAFAPAALPAVEEPDPFPAPSLDDPHGGWVGCERWLAAFVGQAGGDRTALRERLAAFSPLDDGTGPWLDASSWITALAREVLASGSDPGVPDPAPADPLAGTGFSVTHAAADEDESLPRDWRDEIFRRVAELGVFAQRLLMPSPDRAEPRFGLSLLPAKYRTRNRLPDPRNVSGPHMFLLRRFAELYGALRKGALPPVLLATPTSMTGHLAPDVLVERLEVCAAAGVEPLPADLWQALLRLPRGRHAEAAERAARVGSRAAAAVAAWLAGGGLPDPETGVKWGYVRNARERVFDDDELTRSPNIRLIPVLRAEPTGHDLVDELLGEPPRWYREGHGQAMEWWPAILPSHREVVAVNYLPHLLYQWDRPGVYPPHLVALTQADGPAGEATALVLAYFLAAERPKAVQALLRMAARGDLPGAAVGRQLAYLIRRAWFETRPVLAALTEAVHQGAHRQVWEILRTMTPMLLPGKGERPTVVHSELVALTADVASWTGAKGEIPEVASHAARGGRSRFVRECTRLRDLLAPEKTEKTGKAGKGAG
ncbi:DUF6493 family protein [Streptosporangium sp. NPDC049376]|uniref:DUF6493 family protein n=1 Tax=Streptosporangium sp. NPDC049376 TaxID=3366192 RepID=UPI0037877159